MGGEIFSFSMRVRSVGSCKTLEFKPRRISFITNKTMWSDHFRIALREIPMKITDLSSPRPEWRPEPCSSEDPGPKTGDECTPKKYL